MHRQNNAYDIVSALKTIFSQAFAKKMSWENTNSLLKTSVGEIA